MEIFPATSSDLPLIAKCHASAFPDSLSSALGNKYLVSMLSWYLSSEDTFLFFLQDEKTIVGYCGGMIVTPGRRMGSASGMAQHSFASAVMAFVTRPWLIFHPELRGKYRFILKNVARRIKRFLSGADKPQMIPPQNAGIPGEEYTALVVIGVAKEYQGKGYGSRLLAAFEKKTSDLGFRKMLLTVRSNNVQALQAYEKNGWVRSEAGKVSTTMIKSIK